MNLFYDILGQQEVHCFISVNQINSGFVLPMSGLCKILLCFWRPLYIFRESLLYSYLYKYMSILITPLLTFLPKKQHTLYTVITIPKKKKNLTYLLKPFHINVWSMLSSFLTGSYYFI